MRQTFGAAERAHAEHALPRRPLIIYAGSVQRPFVVIRRRGPSWDDSRHLEEQADWAAHATFMDGLADDGFLVLVGPLEGTRDALLVVRAAGPSEIESRLSADPWTANGLLVTKQVAPWQIRIGSLP